MHVMYIYSNSWKDMCTFGYVVIMILLARVGKDLNSNSSVWTVITCIRGHPFLLTVLS